MSWTNEKNLQLLERARLVVPGGMYGHMSTALLPVEFPQFFSHGQGARIWDVDGNEYVDFMCAYGPNLLGYHDPVVDAAAAAQRARGDTLNGPGEVMVELAELFVSMVSHADWAMFCKNGTDATTMAMVMARAHTGRRKILAARDAYHGADPWCVPQVRSAGTLPEDRASIVYYDYNDADSLAHAFRQHEGDVAAVFAVPMRHDIFRDLEAPEPAYAQMARDLCDAHEAVLVIDDVRAGFRVARDCSWSLLGIEPDLSCWGKCFANGHPISAVLGVEKLREPARQIFVTGSYWFSAVAMAAAVATLKQIRDTDYLERMTAAGRQLRDGLHQQARAHGFALRQSGPVQMPQILFEDDPDFRLGYAWSVACLKHGAYFHPYHNMFLSAAHGAQDIERALVASDASFAAIKRARGSIEPVAQLKSILQSLAHA